jgi:hypothetical protein
MLLKEFFGRSLNLKKESSKQDDKGKQDDLFWYILDHDRLHKDYFMPLAKKIKKNQLENVLDNKEIVKEFMPMVNKGCMEYYHKKKMEGRPEKLFNKEMREEICQRLYDHYYEDIIKGSYKL